MELIKNFYWKWIDWYANNGKVYIEPFTEEDLEYIESIKVVTSQDKLTADRRRYQRDYMRIRRQEKIIEKIYNKRIITK